MTLFGSDAEYRARVTDGEFWWPHLTEILRRHGLLDGGLEPLAGFNATHPTFLYGDVVVKLFGHVPGWRRAQAAEAAALAAAATDPGITAPCLLADGRREHWPYLITSVLPGVAARQAELTAAQRVSLAASLGRQVRRVHALPTSGVATQPEVDVVAGARRSSLPPHLAAQVAAYVAGPAPGQDTFVHGDIIANHVYIVDGQLVGLIDWGDAMVTDRHCELIQLYRDLFGCDKSLFHTFLDAADWPVRDDFPRRTLAAALRRQATGLTQHLTIDVFMPIAVAYPLADIPTLDDLATELFAVT